MQSRIRFSSARSRFSSASESPPTLLRTSRACSRRASCSRQAFRRFAPLLRTADWSRCTAASRAASSVSRESPSADGLPQFSAAGQLLRAPSANWERRTASSSAANSASSNGFCRISSVAEKSPSSTAFKSIAPAALRHIFSYSANRRHTSGHCRYCSNSVSSGASPSASSAKIICERSVQLRGVIAPSASMR